jgi:hypothetical protein
MDPDCLDGAGSVARPTSLDMEIVRGYIPQRLCRRDDKSKTNDLRV